MRLLTRDSITWGKVSDSSLTHTILPLTLTSKGFIKVSYLIDLSSCGDITDEGLKNLSNGFKYLTALQSLSLRFGE